MALIVASCATTTSTSSTGSWQEPRTTTLPYDRVLVVALAPDENANRVFEQSLAEAITDGGSTGIPGYKVLGDMGSPDLSREVVIAMAEKSDADAVLVTRIADQEGQLGKSREEAYVHVGPTVTVYQNDDASMTAVMASNYSVEVVPGSSVIKADNVLQTSLYEPRTGDKLIYRTLTEAHAELSAMHPVEEIAYRFAIGISKQLREDGVIR